MNSIIELAHVSKRYGTRAALHDVELNIPPGITGLLGPNGSGKSTLIKAILGLVKIDSGTGRVLDFKWPEQTRALRDKIGYLPEDDCYIQGLQGIESIQMMARLSGLPKLEALRRSHEVADFCDIGQERYRNVETYSTGMRQKLKFAQALVHDPPLVILDEPTTGLDPAQRDEFLDRIAVLAMEKGKHVILSTHILHDVRRICDHIIILAEGRVCVSDSLANLQRPIEAGIQVGVISDAERFAVGLTERGIRAEVTSAQYVKISGLDGQPLDPLWKASVELGVVIQRIDEARNSLEQTFLDAVRAS